MHTFDHRQTAMRPLSGTYALVFKTSRKKRLMIGKLGALHLQRGYYVYIGSAFGPGGLKARIEHHCRKSSRLHWHIDYLSAYLHPEEVWYTYDPAHREHQWSTVLARTAGASMPLPGFGSSDCHCLTHLYFFSLRPSGPSFRRKIHADVADHARVFIKNFLDKNKISDIH